MTDARTKSDEMILAVLDKHAAGGYTPDELISEIRGIVEGGQVSPSHRMNVDPIN